MTRKESTDKRIGDLLDAALLEFVEKGYENTSLESVAMRAGLTKGGLYYHFEGKEDLLIRANQRFMEPVARLMEEAEAATSAADGLSAYIARYLGYWTTRPRELSFFFLSMTKILEKKELWWIFQEYTASTTSFLERIYRKGIAAGEFEAFPIRGVAVALMAALDGVVAYLVADSAFSLRDTISDFIETFVRAHQGGR